MVEDFGKWLNDALIDNDIKASEISRATGVDEGYISRIRNGKIAPSKRAEYLITHYLKLYDVIYVSEEKEANVFCEWLDDILKKRGILDSQLAEQMNISLRSVEGIRRGTTTAKYDLKIDILNFLKREYNIDITHGVWLLNKAVTESRRFGIWLKYEMAKAEITESILARELGYKKKEVEKLTASVRLPDKDSLNKIVQVLKKYNDTINESEIMQQFYDLDAKYKSFGDWLCICMSERALNNIMLSNEIGVYKTMISYYRHGRELPSKDVADKIFAFFTSLGIDTTEGQNIWSRLRKNKYLY